MILRHESRDVARVLIPLAFVAIFRSLGFTLSEMRRHRGPERRKSFSDVPFERITLATVLRIAREDGGEQPRGVKGRANTKAQ